MSDVLTHQRADLIDAQEGLSRSGFDYPAGQVLAKAYGLIDEILYPSETHRGLINALEELRDSCAAVITDIETEQ